MCKSAILSDICPIYAITAPKNFIFSCISLKKYAMIKKQPDIRQYMGKM